nr:immunoglobulin light chain junction region [Macaca mulatta]
DYYREVYDSSTNILF